jgi:hypothetical protein
VVERRHCRVHSRVPGWILLAGGPPPASDSDDAGVVTWTTDPICAGRLNGPSNARLAGVGGSRYRRRPSRVIYRARKTPPVKEGTTRELWRLDNERPSASWIRLTKCASAAGDHARAHTNLRSTARSRRAPPERSSAPLRPVGCMRGLGGSARGAPHDSTRRRIQPCSSVSSTMDHEWGCLCPLGRAPRPRVVMSCA